MRHDWDHNKPEGYSTCAVCGLSVKTWKAKKGNLPQCDPSKMKQVTLQASTNYIPPCMNPEKKSNPVISCFECPGRIKAKKCDNLRLQGSIALENMVVQ